MKRIAAISIMMCVLAVACINNPDDRAFIRNMYEKSLYEDYTFLERHCSKDLLTKLAEEYDYEGEGYAVWKFRSAAQDGPSKEYAMKSIEDEGNGWYKYTAIDMGITFTKRIKISHKGRRIIIENIVDGYRLVGNDGGTCVARNWDEHVTCTKIGKTEVVLADDFIIIDCGSFPEDPIDTISTGQKQYIEKLKDGRRDFFNLSTRVTIGHGKITEINRKWIP